MLCDGQDNQTTSDDWLTMVENLCCWEKTVKMFCGVDSIY